MKEQEGAKVGARESQREETKDFLSREGVNKQEKERDQSGGGPRAEFSSAANSSAALHV